MSALMPLTTCIEHLARHFEKMDVDDRKDSIMFLDRLTRDPLSYPKVMRPGAQQPEAGRRRGRTLALQGFATINGAPVVSKSGKNRQRCKR